MVRSLTLLVTAALASGEAPWSQLWLHYDPVSSSYAGQIHVPEVICADGTSEAPILGRACDEIVTGLTGLLGRAVPKRTDIVLWPGSVMLEITTDGQLTAETDMAWPPSPQADGYSIAATLISIAADGYSIATSVPSGVPATLISASSHRGLLYGVFRYLHLVRTEDAAVLSPSFHVTSIPSSPLRMWNLWDNQDGTIERGYAGKSVFEWDELPTLKPRYTDYARLLASVGINAIVWDNVNACTKPNIPLLRSRHIQKFSPLAGLFAEFGIWTFFVPCFSDPIHIGGLKTADPSHGEVAQWWHDKVSELKAAMPTFRGFLVKADSEGQPGPNTYGRTELDGANMLGAALAPAEAIVIWRCFAHPPHGVDQALFQYEQYINWDGQFHPNVVLQPKNGPWDFQVREPVHALFGRMTKTNFILEFEATQEYLGQAKHVVHLPAQWDYYLSWNTGALDQTGVSQTLGQYISGRGTHQVYTGVAAVSNFGRDANWAGHEMSTANTYGFGRLAWSPELHAKTITEEWIKATWGVDAEVVSSLTAMLLESWETFENYTSPLGAGFICSAKNHYDMDPGHRASKKFIYATKWGVGYDRWKGFGQKYLEPMASKLGTRNPDDCPEELLLSFHHVPYDYKLKGKGGISVIDYIYESHRTGAARAATWPARWRSLEGKVVEGAYGAGAFAAVAERLDKGASEAATFAKTVTKWFEHASGIRAPPFSIRVPDTPVAVPFLPFATAVMRKYETASGAPSPGPVPAPSPTPERSHTSETTGAMAQITVMEDDSVASMPQQDASRAAHWGGGGAAAALAAAALAAAALAAASLAALAWRARASRLVVYENLAEA